jgi:hypothetical protein
VTGGGVGEDLVEQPREPADALARALDVGSGAGQVGHPARELGGDRVGAVRGVG